MVLYHLFVKQSVGNEVPNDIKEVEQELELLLTPFINGSSHGRTLVPIITKVQVHLLFEDLLLFL